MTAPQTLRLARTPLDSPTANLATPQFNSTRMTNLPFPSATHPYLYPWCMAKRKTNYMKQADAAFSKYIRNRDGRCMSCGANSNLQCAHIISRSYKSIRTDERNAIALCRSCHVRYTHRPLEWEEWIEKKYPGRWQALKFKALEYGRVDWKEEAQKWKGKISDHS